MPLPGAEASLCGPPYFLKLLRTYVGGKENFSVQSLLHLYPYTCVLPFRERGVILEQEEGYCSLGLQSHQSVLSLPGSLNLRGKEAENSVCSQLSGVLRGQAILFGARVPLKLDRRLRSCLWANTGLELAYTEKLDWNRWAQGQSTG